MDDAGAVDAPARRRRSRRRRCSVGSSLRRRQTRNAASAAAATSQTGFTPPPPAPRARATAPRRPAAASGRRGRPRPRARRRRCGTGRPRSAPSRTRARARRRRARTAASASSIGRAERAGGGLEVVDDQVVGQVGAGGLDGPAPLGEVRLAAGEVHLVGPPEDVGRRQRLGHAAGRGPRSRPAAPRARAAPRPRRSRGSAPGGPAPGRRRRGRTRSRAAGRRRRRPRRASQPQRGAAASAEPPAMPAATGMRLSIVSRTGGPSQPVARAERAQRGGGEVRGPRRPGTTTSSASAPSGAARARRSSASVDRLEDRHELVAAVGARRGPRNRQRLIFAGARVVERDRHRSASHERAEVLGREPLGAHVGGMAERVERRAGAVAHAGGRRRARARASAPSALRRCANAGLDERRAASGGGARAAALEHDEHGVDVRHRVEDRARRRPAARARRRRAARAPTGTP